MKGQVLFMKCVLDSTVFFSEYSIEGDLYTTTSVIGELVDFHAKCRYEKLAAEGLHVTDPQQESKDRVMAAAEKTRDSRVISGTDQDLIALALDLDAVIFTDDFAIQNIAAELGVAIHPIQQRAAKKIIWKYRCSGCGRYFKTDGECLICGSKIKRKLK
jgi:endoribonuclease Nob1